VALATVIALGTAVVANAQSVMEQCGEQWQAQNGRNDEWGDMALVSNPIMPSAAWFWSCGPCATSHGKRRPVCAAATVASAPRARRPPVVVAAIAREMARRPCSRPRIAPRRRTEGGNQPADKSLINRRLSLRSQLCAAKAYSHRRRAPCRVGAQPRLPPLTANKW
jgi:hypothetical protein